MKDFADGELTHIADFDWHGLEERLGEPMSPDEFWKAADCLAYMMSWVFAAPTPHARFIRFVAMASGLHPDKWPTLQGVADKSGCVKATISRASKKAEKEFGLHFIRSKPTTACEKMSKRRKGGPSRRKARIDTDAIDEASKPPSK